MSILELIRKINWVYDRSVEDTNLTQLLAMLTLWTKAELYNNAVDQGNERKQDRLMKEFQTARTSLCSDDWVIEYQYTDDSDLCYIRLLGLFVIADQSGQTDIVCDIFTTKGDEEYAE